MNVGINLLQKARPYKIDIFGLQDNFIGSLQSYKDVYLGQVVEPRMELKDDGTQTFTCKIPKFYIDESTNQKIINPRWEDAEKGILAENTRILKVTIDFAENQRQTYPFIIDKITNKRENNFSVYKEINATGLAFAELGKTGYKIELNNTILENDFAKDDTTLATIDYWLDKIFPNEKNEDGVITKWLTPWCYEIRMDWSGYFDQLSDIYVDGGDSDQLEGYKFYTSKNASEIDEEKLKKWTKLYAGLSTSLYSPKDSSKIYENPYISNWDVINGKLTPTKVENFIEKARYVNCANSNRYNITQVLAETFEVFCTYEYTCDTNGYFKKTYYDNDGNIWTGKKVVFFNRAIKTENPFVLNYEHNLQSISKIIDSSELYTKMYINPIASETMADGYVSISNTNLNPLLEDFILNFDYLYSIGSINDLQKTEISNYEIKIHKLNKELVKLEEEYNELIVELNDLESQKALSEASLASAREQLLNYETLRDNEVTNIPVIRNNSNSYSLVMVPQTNYNTVQGNFKLEGINIASIKGWRNNNYGIDDGNFTDKPLFTSNELIHAQSSPSSSDTYTDKWFVTFDEYGFPASLFTSKENTIFKNNTFGNNFDINTGAIIYLELEYCPKNKYAAICDKYYSLIEKELANINNYESIIGTDESEDYNEWTGLKYLIKNNENSREELYNKKNLLTFRLERILGPALREGYWQPDEYEDPGEGHNDTISFEKPIKDQTELIFDSIPFKEEQLNYYYTDSNNITEEGKTYYSYIDLTTIYKKIGDNNNLSDFCISLVNPDYTWIIPNGLEVKANETYSFLLDGKYYSFQLKEKYYSDFSSSPKKIDILTLHTKDKSTTQKAPYLSIQRSEYIDGSNPRVIKEYVKINGPFDSLPSNNNLTTAFMGLNQYLSSRNLHNNSGFVFSFLKRENDYIPVALLTSNDIDYNRYKTVLFSFDNNITKENSDDIFISQNVNKYPIVYPRIFLNYKNVNTKTDNFKVSVTADSKKLIKLEDYSCLLRKGKTYVTLKITNNNILKYILDEPYNIIYQVSKANEMLYLDAKQVAKDNSKPKYSYEVSIANIPNNIEYIELGQLVHINDYSVDAYKEYGYISSLSYQLDQPKNDSITISNYKTKFEDLFSSISAQNEAMKQNSKAYSIAAASFSPNGEIQQSVLQTTLDNNNFAFNFSNSNITLDDTGGLILTNVNQSSNGVYGQVALRGGGVFCSNAVDQKGKRIWTTGITPDGINASLITAGRLDTNLIRIYAGDTLAFQWSSEGLFAYKETTTENGSPSLDEQNYIRLNEEGLKYVNNGNAQLNLGWDGLLIQSSDGHVKLTGEEGLTIYNQQDKPMAIFGKEANEYGMFLKNNNGEITLKTNNEGNLELQNILLIGNKAQDNNFAGLCGIDHNDYKDPITKKMIRFWAGSKNPQEAKFTVCEDGIAKAEKLIITDGGSIIFKKANSDDLILTYDKVKALL